MANNFYNNREINNSQTRAAIILREQRLGMALPAMYNSLLQLHSNNTASLTSQVYAGQAAINPNSVVAQEISNTNTAAAASLSYNNVGAEVSYPVQPDINQKAINETAFSPEAIQPSAEAGVSQPVSEQELEREKFIQQSQAQAYSIHEEYK